MKLHYLLVSLCACYIGGAQADIYKHVDADGHVGGLGGGVDGPVALGAQGFIGAAQEEDLDESVKVYLSPAVL